MKLHRITVENLNSLYGSHTVDFDGSLEGASLFLIHGPTGSGKSTLMDAVSLALFATTPRMREVRSDREIADQIMSRGAGTCSAELEFSKLEPGSGERRRYRAKWVARRARERADGTVQATERSLERLDDDQWRILVSDKREKEVAPWFEEVLEGFTPEDFQRSMLLAQGEFDAMLHARPQERASILERLTSTERYRALGARAARLHKAWNRRLERLEDAVRLIGAVDPGALEAARGQAKAAASALAEATGQVTALEAVDRWRRDLARKREELARAQERHARARAAWDALADDRAALHAFDEARPALERLAALDRNRTVREAAARELGAQRKALPGLVETAAAAASALEKTQEAYDHAKTVRDRLGGPLQRVREADASLRQARAALEKAEARVAESARGVEKEQAEEQKARREAREAREALRRAVLDDPGPEDAVRERLREALASTTALDAAEGEASGDLSPARGVLDREADRCRTDGRALKGAWEARTGLDGDRREMEAARTEAETGAATLEEQRTALAGAVGSLAEAEAAATEARTAFETLLHRRGFAGHRADLKAGEPCPLCGSEHHPWAGDGAPDHDAEFHAAETRRARAEASVQAARTLRDRIRGRLDQLEAASQDAERRLGELRERASRAAAAWEEACRAAGLDPALDAEAVRRRSEAAAATLTWLGSCDTALTRLESRLEVLAARRTTLEAARGRQADAAAERDRDREGVATAGATLEQAQQDCATVWAATARPDDPDDRPGADVGPDVVERYQKGRIDALERARDEARGQLDAARGGKETCEREIARLEKVEAEAAAEAAAAESALRDALADLDVDSEEELRARRLPDDRVRDLRGRIATANEALQQATGTVQARSRDLTDHESARPDHPRVDTPDEELAAALLEARAAREAADQAHGERVRELRNLQDAAERAREAGERLERARTEARVWQRLHALIGVRDGEQFKEFAQALNLRRLLHQANRQLARLKDRYELKQIWTGSREGSADGDDAPRFPTLEFEVEDRYRPGTPRSIKTLSGGESFLVSLALALGLSDLRTSSMPVETLLLDEGFGTLDPETLDTALAALQQLQATGRQIGIISHVVGLKERIEARIEVRAVGEGRSEIRVGVEGGS